MRNYKVERIKDNEKKPTRYYSSRQEKNVANKFDGVRTSNSGATPFDKSDVKLNNFLIECKTKTKDSEQISIKKEWLDKLKSESCFMGKDYSALVFNFGPSDNYNYVIIDEYLFKFLVDKIDEIRDRYDDAGNVI